MRTLNARRTLASGLLPLALLALLAPASAHAQTRIRLATLLPRGGSHFHILEGMGQQWKAVSNGGVTLTIYPDGTLGTEEDTVRRMRVGEIQAATLSVAGLSEIDPSVGALEKIPMVYRSLEEVEYVRAKMQPEMERRLAQKDFIVLFWADAGWMHFFSRKPALRPEDFKKTRVFVGVSDQDEIAIAKGLGFQAVPLAWTDVLTSLQTGLVDSVPTPPFLALAGQYDLVARHMLEVKWVPLVGATVMTRKAWEKIPADKREALLKASAEAGKQMQARSRAESSEALEAMEKRGLQVHAVPPELENEWRQFAEGIYPKMRGTMVPADMFDEVRRLVAEYRARKR
ncbi:MAG TPA: TRAP transporter substrate-binding protein DctP [Candidatus Acidoferrales bacterium]